MKDVIGNLLRVTPAFRGKWRLRRAWESHLSKADRRTAVLPDGSIVDVDMSIPYDRMVWLQDEEWNDLRYLQHRLSKGETFVDVGANIGLWTLVAASAVGRNGRIFSFEPNPSTFRRLIANIERNHQSDVVTALPHAVSRANGVVSFDCPVEHNLSVISDSPQSDGSVSVQTVSLDSTLEGVKVAGIKLDTEGHELWSLEGALHVIEASSPWLITEFNTTLLDSVALADWRVYQLLVSLGYKAFIYDRRGENPIDASFSLHGYCNILFQRC